MSKIVDISEHQVSNTIDWPTFSQNVDLLIIRVQYGSTHPDKEYKNHVANAKRCGVSFHTYAFPAFIDVKDARVEAKDAAARQDGASKGMVIDIESEYDSNRNPVGITKLPQSVRLEGIKAYVDELRKQGVKTVGAYVAHNIYKAWAIDSIIGLFDYVWIPRYGTNNGQPQTKPDYPCDIWQYSSVGRVPGYGGNLDLNTLNGNKTLNWFTGKMEVKVVSVTNSEYIGKTLTVKTDGLWFYNTPRWDVKGGESAKGNSFIITEELLVNGARMLKCHDGKYRTADPQYVDVNPKPSDWPYRVIVDGINYAQAAEIVKLLQTNYKGANIYGEAK